jgi:hypothetical protein
MTLFRTVLGLKVRTFLAVIIIGSPVWGLRPLRLLFFLTAKLPKPVIFTVSSVSRVFLIVSRIVSRYVKAPSFVSPVLACIYIY